MFIRAVTLAATLAVVTVVGAQPPAASAAPPSPRRLIVLWQEGAPAAERRQARAEAEVEFVRDLGDRRFQLVETEPGASPAAAIRDLEADPAVELATRDTAFTEDAIPDDPLFGYLWGLRNTGQNVAGFVGALPGSDIAALDAWERTVGDPDIVVAVLDSGYRFDHPDLAGVAWENPGEVPDAEDNDGNGIVDDLHGADFVGADLDQPQVDGDPSDDDHYSGGHGVHTAGTIGAQGDNGIGITGVAQDARLMPLRVCSRSWKEGDRACLASAIVAAINYAGAKGARVANMSFGGTKHNPAVAAAIANNPHVLFVASAGNDAQDNEKVPKYPCNYRPASEGGTVENLICVAATDQADKLASFSNWGSQAVDLGAPGTETLSTHPLRPFFFDDFEQDDFASRWEASGEDGGFARVSGAPLASFGIAAFPGGTSPAGAEIASTSAPVELAPGHKYCDMGASSVVKGGSLRLELLLDDELVMLVGTPKGHEGTTSLQDMLDPGGELRVRFTYVAPATPKAGDGAWVEAVQVRCRALPGEANGYVFLQGTSMATPHVSGAAALLFSHKPEATVAEAREALLGSVDKRPALAGKTATGGRLDAGAALALLAGEAEGPGEGPGGDPGGGDPDPEPGGGDPGSGSGGGAGPAQPPAPAASGAATSGDGSSVPTPTRRCVVPRLAGMSPAQARKALRRASCSLGQVRRPRAAKLRRGPLVVRSSRPGAGARRPAGTRVAITLTPALRR